MPTFPVLKAEKNESIVCFTQNFRVFPRRKWHFELRLGNFVWRISWTQNHWQNGKKATRFFQLHKSWKSTLWKIRFCEFTLKMNVRDCDGQMKLRWESDSATWISWDEIPKRKLGQLHLGDILPREWNWKLSPKGILKHGVFKIASVLEKNKTVVKGTIPGQTKMDHFEFSDVISLSKREKRCYFCWTSTIFIVQNLWLAWLWTVCLVWFRRVANVAVAPQGPKRKGSCSNHWFLEAMSVSGSVLQRSLSSHYSSRNDFPKKISLDKFQ